MISSFHAEQRSVAGRFSNHLRLGTRVVTPESGLVTGALRRVPKGEVLYSEGDVASTPLLVVNGVLRVMVRAATGRDRLADLAGSGDVLATSVFDSSPCAETVIAASDALVAEIDVNGTLERVQGRTELAAALVRQLNRSREMADDLGLPMGARICRILARLAERLGDKLEAGPADGRGTELEWRHLPFNLTHDDVALLAGCARVTATRVIGELKEAQVLEGHRGNYSVVPSALDAAADEYVYEVL